MSDDSDYEYCDGLFKSAVCAAIIEGGGDYQIPYDIGFSIMISDYRIMEIVLDMTGCLDSELI